MAKKTETKRTDISAHEGAGVTETSLTPSSNEQQPVAPVADPMDALPAFIRQHEDAAAQRGIERGVQIVVVAISHPAADEAQAIYSGRYGGIRVSRGAAGAVYSDGSKHTAP